jgi:translocation protein SEC63
LNGWKKIILLGVIWLMPSQLKVEEAPIESDDEWEDDISEPEEDSLAGQMAMMRGSKVKPSAVHGGDEDEGEGSGSEYESSSDEEGPRKRAINEDSDSDSD